MVAAWSPRSTWRGRTAAHGRSARLPSAHGGSGCTGSSRVSAVELGPEESRCALEDFVGAAQFPVLPLQLHQPLPLLGGEPWSLALVDLGPPYPQPQGLGMNAHLRGDRSDRLPFRGVLASVVQHQPDRPVTNVLGIPACPCHRSILSRNGASRIPGAVQASSPAPVGSECVATIGWYRALHSPHRGCVQTHGGLPPRHVQAPRPALGRRLRSRDPSAGQLRPSPPCQTTTHPRPRPRSSTDAASVLPDPQTRRSP